MKKEINELEKEIRELSSAISVAEQVRAGTYVQELVSSENIRRNADILPNGVFKILKMYSFVYSALIATAARRLPSLLRSTFIYIIYEGIAFIPP